MKTYMITAFVEGETFAKFADTYNEARSIAMNIECGLGGYFEIYEREETEAGSEYRFLEA